jgi:hypothetical protein
LSSFSLKVTYSGCCSGAPAIMPFICLSTFSTVKARRDDAARFAQAQSLRQLGELHREQFQARDVGSASA